MIAGPEDDRRRRMRDDPTLLDVELDRIERADGRLDRHAGYVPERSGYTLDVLDVVPRPLLERPSWLARLATRLRALFGFVPRGR